MSQLREYSAKLIHFGRFRTWHPRRLDPWSFSAFHTSGSRAKIKPFLLPDIGEGIREVQIIQWFVQPEARVEQFDKLCEVQSDKAAAEITSRYDGVIRKIYYEAEEMAQVGKPLCDIDVQEEDEDDATFTEAITEARPETETPLHQEHPSSTKTGQAIGTGTTGRHASLATPAVRGMLKSLNFKIEDIVGTGKGGRVMKDDVYQFAMERDRGLAPTTTSLQHSSSSSTDDVSQREKRIPLTRMQSQMFNTMTRSLSIPHFLYADEINLTALSTMRQSINADPAKPRKLSFLPFIIKAVSLALADHPLLNSQLVVDEPGGSPPQIVMRSKHNIGVAMDTPQGLLVPNIKNVSSLSIYSIAAELARLQQLAQGGQLGVPELTGGTITVSNIGSIGGTYVAPVLVPTEVAILGIGRSRTIPAFDEQGTLVKKEVANFSWSADHRLVDGATMARMAERVRGYVEDLGTMMARL